MQPSIPIPKHSWKITTKEEEFSSWLRGSNSLYLFFNGAFKSNPGIASAGRFIYNPSGRIIATYEWGLGNLSNNKVESLALYQALNKIQNLGINKAMIFGDSATIISLMVWNQRESNIFLQKMINKF